MNWDIIVTQDRRTIDPMKTSSCDWMNEDGSIEFQHLVESTKLFHACLNLANEKSS